MMYVRQMLCLWAWGAEHITSFCGKAAIHHSAAGITSFARQGKHHDRYLFRQAAPRRSKLRTAQKRQSHQAAGVFFIRSRIRILSYGCETRTGTSAVDNQHFTHRRTGGVSRGQGCGIKKNHNHRPGGGYDFTGGLRCRIRHLPWPGRWQRTDHSNPRRSPPGPSAPRTSG